MAEMTGWVLLFELVGIGTIVHYVMRFIYWLDRGCK